MSFLFGSSPDTGEQHALEQQARGAIQGANANVPIVDFGQSSLAGMTPEGRNAMLASIQGYKDIVSAPGGLDAKARAALTEGRLGAEQESAARTQEIQDMAARRGAASSGEAAAEQAIQEQGAATRGTMAGVQGAALGEEARQAALRGEAATGEALSASDVNRARTMDTYNLANEENKQRMLQQQFINALAKGSAFGNLMGEYSGTAAGGGYGLLKSGLLGSALGQGAASQMAGGATSAGSGLFGMLGGGSDVGAGAGAMQDAPWAMMVGG